MSLFDKSKVIPVDDFEMHTDANLLLTAMESGKDIDWKYCSVDDLQTIGTILGYKRILNHAKCFKSTHENITLYLSTSDEDKYLDQDFHIMVLRNRDILHVYSQPKVVTKRLVGAIESTLHADWQNSYFAVRDFVDAKSKVVQ